MVFLMVKSQPAGGRLYKLTEYKLCSNWHKHEGMNPAGGFTYVCVCVCVCVCLCMYVRVRVFVCVCVFVQAGIVILRQYQRFFVGQ